MITLSFIGIGLAFLIRIVIEVAVGAYVNWRSK